METAVCALCGRSAPLTRHHLIPKARNRKRKRVDKLAATEHLTVDICRPCHDMVHRHVSLKSLEREHDSLEKLRDHPEIAKFSAWLSTKPADFRPRV